MRIDFPLFTPVFVTWIDSMSSDRMWVDLDSFDFDFHTLSSKTLTSVGFIVNIDDDNLFLSDSVSAEEGIMYGCMSIPLVAIQDIKPMEVSMAKKKPKGKC